MEGLPKPVLLVSRMLRRVLAVPRAGNADNYWLFARSITNLPGVNVAPLLRGLPPVSSTARFIGTNARRTPNI